MCYRCVINLLNCAGSTRGWIGRYWRVLPLPNGHQLPGLHHGGEACVEESVRDFEAFFVCRDLIILLLLADACGLLK